MRTFRHPAPLSLAVLYVLTPAFWAVHGYLSGHNHVTADALLAAAAIGQALSGTTPAGPRPRLRAARYLPFVAIAVAHALVLAAVAEEDSFYPWGGLAAGSAVLTTVVLWRQILVQRESDERSVTDGLTGLANRARFREVSHRALARGARTGRHSGLLVIDMNGFKQVNDTLGRNLGDLVLVEFARVLRLSVGSPGLPARLGGDEFAVVLPDLVSPEQAYEVAGRLAASMAPVIVAGNLIMMAASIGVAVSAPGELTHDVLVHRADLAMGKAKQFAPETRWAAWREAYEQEAGVALAA
jgi:diguanylate cyclase (GGDEF)-like protein